MLKYYYDIKNDRPIEFLKNFKKFKKNTQKTIDKYQKIIYNVYTI